MGTAEPSLISIQKLCKAFASNPVLKGINLEVSAGEVVAIIGGNGAGKSTLMKILMGIHQPDSGSIYIAGEKTSLSTPSAALSKGIYYVPQEPMLFPNMTVEENIVLGFNQNKKELRKQLVKLIETLGWDLNLNAYAKSLSIAEQQLVEILRGLLRESKILILDEPTSALTFNEITSLFKIIERLHKEGIAIFYITHRLSEVFQVATRVIILRDGIITLDGSVGEFTKEMLIRGLLPADFKQEAKAVEHNAPKPHAHTDNKKPPILELKELSGYGYSNINLSVYSGEILGVAGVVGAGRTDLAMSIFGINPPTDGSVMFDGKDITGKSLRDIIDLGLNYLPEDRHLNGIFGISSVCVNTSSTVLHKIGKLFLKNASEAKLTQKYIEDFRIKVTGQDQLVGSLSGGNQQKVVLAKTLTTEPKLVILDEPTRGIDAAARADVYKIINLLKEQNVAVMLISSDLEEIVELSDKAITMYQGRINNIFNKEEINLDVLMASSFGVHEKEAGY